VAGTPKCVFDASAVVALLMKEKGHQALALVVKERCVIAATNLIEAIWIARRHGYTRTAGEILDDLLELGVVVEPVTIDDVLEAEYQLRTAAELAAANPNVGSLSLGDATCLAVARRLDLPAVVSDGTWELLESGVTIQAFR
jgi:PIN domain nuclease of toxin-antitoxin system